MENSGQAVLLLLVVVVVALGLGLSVMSQSTSDIRITEQEQEAARAFSAAEAGIEAALKNVSIAGGSLDIEGIPVEYSVTGQDFLQGRFSENEPAQIILAGSADTLTVKWADKNNPQENPGNCSGVQAASGQTAASLLISIIDSSYQVRRLALNACSLSSSNNFTDVATAGGGNYLRKYSLPVLAADRQVRITPVYNLTTIEVTAAGSLPNQSYLISSAASAPSEETKAIEVTRSEPAAPPLFDYVLFSGGSLVK